MKRCIFMVLLAVMLPACAYRFRGHSRTDIEVEVDTRGKHDHRRAEHHPPIPHPHPWHPRHPHPRVAPPTNLIPIKVIYNIVYTNDPKAMNPQTFLMLASNWVTGIETSTNFGKSWLVKAQGNYLGWPSNKGLGTVTWVVTNSSPQQWYRAYAH
jgi:hypothetical protein